MKGSIRRRGKESWQIVISQGFGSDGKRVRKFFWVTGKKADAEWRLRELLDASDKGLSLDTTKLSVAQFLEHWLSSYVETNTRPRTAQSYVSRVALHIAPRLGALPLAKLGPAEIQRTEAALLESGLSARSVVHVHRVLGEALRYAVRWGLLYRNPIEAVTPPRATAYEAKIPDVAGVGHLLESARASSYYAAFYVLAFSGVRRGEALALRWQEVDLDRSIISITQALQRIEGKGLMFLPPKSAKGRRAIAVDAGTVNVLREHRGRQLLQKMQLGEVWADTGLVFTNELGGPLDPATLTHAWKRLTTAAGLEGVRLHDLRHFHASLLLREGVHPKVVQERLGHSTISITLDTYSHVMPGLQEQAARTFAKAMQNGKAPVGEG